MKGKYAESHFGCYTSFGFSRPFVDFKLTEEDNGEEEALMRISCSSDKRKKKNMAKKALADMKKRETNRKERWRYCYLDHFDWVLLSKMMNQSWIFDIFKMKNAG